jgi:hypothetical protein
MEDIPQPASRPYSAGDRVQIYVESRDLDSKYHGTICEVVDVHTDDLNRETGRENDAYSYELKTVDTDEKLPITFRHRDLVPADSV